MEFVWVFMISLALSRKEWMMILMSELIVMLFRWAMRESVLYSLSKRVKWKRAIFLLIFGKEKPPFNLVQGSI